MIHSTAQTHVRKFITKIVHRQGFSHPELGFINATIVSGYRYRQIDREETYRIGLRLTRDTAGEETFLLDSGVLVTPSIRLFDAMRVEPDVVPVQENYVSDDSSDAKAYNVLHTGANRLWLGRVIGVDPDVVFFRHRRNLLDGTQTQWLRDVIEASHYRCLSNRVTWLDEEEKEAVRAFLVVEDEPLEVLGCYRLSLSECEIDLIEAVEGAPPAYSL